MCPGRYIICVHASSVYLAMHVMCIVCTCTSPVPILYYYYPGSLCQTVHTSDMLLVYIEHNIMLSKAVNLYQVIALLLVYAQITLVPRPMAKF